jgi:hypothetical protein
MDGLGEAKIAKLMRNPYEDLDGTGFGHADDRLLSAKLLKYAKQGDKYEASVGLSSSQSNNLSSDRRQGRSFGA